MRAGLRWWFIWGLGAGLLATTGCDRTSGQPEWPALACPAGSALREVRSAQRTRRSCVPPGGERPLGPYEERDAAGRVLVSGAYVWAKWFPRPGAGLSAYAITKKSMTVDQIWWLGLWLGLRP